MGAKAGLAAAQLQGLAQQWALLPLCLLLCLMYAADTIMVAASLHWYQQNPTSAQLLLLAEVLKLAIALGLAVLVEGAWCCQRRGDESKPITGTVVEKLPLVQSPKAQATWLVHLQQVLQRPGMASQVLHFSVPAVCYFVSNNLSFYALRLLPAYTYMLLTSLKILTTALLSHTFLGKDIPAHQQVSYVLMLLAVNLGTAKSSSVSHSPYLSYNVPWGMLVMLAVAGCSALATVYTEWVMNYSCYKQESINLQNARLYVAGVVLNGGYYLWQAVSKEWSGGQTGTGGAWSDIRLLHWGIIISLAFMGLLVSVIIKWHGSGVKVMASATAMFASAWASQVFLGEAAPGLFWLGAAAAAAALLLHSSLIPLPGSSNGEVVLPGVDSDSEGGRKKRGVQLLWAALVVTMAVAAFTAWNSRPPLPVSQQPAALSGQGPAAADTTPGASVAAAATAMAAAKAGAATGHRRVSSSASNASRVLGEMPHDANLRVPAEFLPIDYPGNRQVCADLTCSLDASCTADDPACCTYFHVRLLDFFNRFTAAYGLEREWFVVYGIVLGAVRHPGGFLPWTNDVDLGTSPRLINFLESTAVRDELWQYGYYFFKSNLWKVCAHPMHPDPAWQKAFTKPVFAGEHGAPVPTPTNPRPGFAIPDRGLHTVVYLDLWPAAPLGSSSGSYFSCDPCPDPSKQASRHLWHLFSNTGWLEVTGKRKASIGGVWTTIPDNAEEHLALVYGPDWRTPDYKYHGKWQEEGWICPRKDPFSGAPDAFTLEELTTSKLLQP